MKYMTKRICAALMGAALLVYPVCAGAEPVATQTDAERIAALEARVQELESYVSELEAQLGVESDSSYAPDAAAAEFDGGVVTVAEAEEAYRTIASYYELLGIDEADYADDAKLEVLNGLVEDKILELRARALGVYELSDAQQAEIEAQVNQEYEDNVAYYMEFRTAEGKSAAEVRAETVQYLEENGYSYDELLADATADVWRENLYDAVTAEIRITDQDVRDYYESALETAQLAYSVDYAAYENDRASGTPIVWNPEGVRRIRAILIGFDEAQQTRYEELQSALADGDTARLDDVDALYAELQPRVDELLEKIAAGEDFGALMDAYSADEELQDEPARSEGYYVSQKSAAYDEAFLNAAMALATPGALSDAVRVDGGIYILRYEADVPAGAVDFDAVRDALLEVTETQIKDETYNDQVDAWVAAANVVYYPERL